MIRTKSSAEIQKVPAKLGNALTKVGIKILVIVVIVVVLWKLFLSNFDFKSMIAGNHVEVQNITVEQVMQAIGELNTYEYQYTGQTDIHNTRQLLGLDIPGTTHKIHAVYNGVIKVGYDMGDMEITVNNTTKTITIKVPDARVTDNYIDTDDVQITVDNNVFNPADTETEVDEALKTEKENQLQEAINNGLYQKAEIQAEVLIKGLLSGFDGYSIVFR